jgi:hypothetical protein
MNTGIQDAYNLAWKLALVLKRKSPESLLDSYEAERRPVGEDVLARTIAATQKIYAPKAAEDRLADTQVLISYRGTAWVENSAGSHDESEFPIAGDRAPDCQGLHRFGVGFPMRLFDVLRGTEHVLLSYLTGSDLPARLADLANFMSEVGMDGFLRFAVIVDPETNVTELPGLPIYQDSARNFRKNYGAVPAFLLVRPDGHLAWRSGTLRDMSLTANFEKIFVQSAAQAPSGGRIS